MRVRVELSKVIEGARSAPTTCLGRVLVLLSCSNLPVQLKHFSKQFQAAASPLTKIFTRL